MITGAALALLVPAAAQAADPPTCSSLGYNYPFFRIDGSTFAGNTRWLELRQAKTAHPDDPVNHPGDQYNPKYDSDPEYPFHMKVTRTQHATRTFTIKSYGGQGWADPRNQFRISFNHGEHATATAKYVEVHQEYLLVTTFVRCTRTIHATFKRPPRQRPGGGGGGDDGDDDPED